MIGQQLPSVVRSWASKAVPGSTVKRPASGEDRPARPKKVLLVAFDFPPRRTSGIYRPTAFVKYLPWYGWQPTVLTIRDADALEDPTLLEKIPPGVEVVRTPYLRLANWEDKIYAGFRRIGLLQPVADQTPSRSADGNHTFVSSPQNGRVSAGSVLRMTAAALRSALYFPDDSAGWIPVAFLKALELNLQHRFDAVYTTHPPRSAHIVGWMLKVFCGLPWIAEFRDPWVLPDHEQPIFRNQVPARRRNKWVHRAVLRRADAVVTVTSRHAQELESYFGVPREKLVVVTNGFDEGDYRGLEGMGPSSMYDQQHVHLAHFGTVYTNFSGQFFSALNELLGAQPELKNILRVHVIGYPDEAVRRFAEGDLQSVLQIHGFVEHNQALQAMRDCHALLLFYGHRYTSKASIPGKLYEYLRIGRPILALAYPGGVEDLIRCAGAGWVLAPDDVAGIKETLKTIIGACQTRRPLATPDTRVVAQYRYDRLTERVANLLDRVAATES